MCVSLFEMFGTAPRCPNKADTKKIHFFELKTPKLRFLESETEASLDTSLSPKPISSPSVSPGFKKDPGGGGGGGAQRPTEWQRRTLTPVTGHVGSDGVISQKRGPEIRPAAATRSMTHAHTSLAALVTWGAFRPAVGAGPLPPANSRAVFSFCFSSFWSLAFLFPSFTGVRLILEF